MKRHVLPSTLTAGLIALATPSPAQETYEFDDIVYLSCAEAWQESGELVENAISMIKTMAQFSLDKRQLSVPEGEADLSDEFGELVKAYCTAEPESLLYNAVDRSIRRLLL